MQILHVFHVIKVKNIAFAVYYYLIFFPMQKYLPYDKALCSRQTEIIYKKDKRKCALHRQLVESTVYFIRSTTSRVKWLALSSNLDNGNQKSWDTDSNKSADFLLNSILLSYMSVNECNYSYVVIQRK